MMHAKEYVNLLKTNYFGRAYDFCCSIIKIPYLGFNACLTQNIKTSNSVCVYPNNLMIKNEF